MEEHSTKEELTGLAALNQDVLLFNYANVVVCKNFKKSSSVRILSYDNNPKYAEFVGKGMLTAALIQGENTENTSSSKTMLRTIRELSLSNSKGVLVIVHANNNELLSCGVAVERSLSDNINIKLLNTSDINKNILLNKIAGAMSDNDQSLTEIYEFCEKCNMNMVNLSIDNPTTVPNRQIGKRIRLNSSVIIKNLVESVKQCFEPYTCSYSSVVLLINNVNTLNSKHEECIFIKELTSMLHSLSIKINRLYLGTFLINSFNVNNVGISVTFLEIFDDNILEYLYASCSAEGWNSLKTNECSLNSFNSESFIVNGSLKEKDRLSSPIRGPKFSKTAENTLIFSLKFALDALISCEKQINTIDSEKSNGNVGTRLKTLSKTVHKQIKDKKLVTSHPYTFFESLSKLSEKIVHGKLGCIYGIMFAAAANFFGKLSKNDKITPNLWIGALQNACDSIKRYGNVAYGNHTLYDVLVDCTNQIKSELGKNDSDGDMGLVLGAFEKGAEIAQKSAEKCRKYGERYPDVGAHSVGIWMRAVYEGVKQKC